MEYYSSLKRSEPTSMRRLGQNLFDYLIPTTWHSEEKLLGTKKISGGQGLGEEGMNGQSTEDI